MTGCNMDEEAETKEIEQWLRMVDKPLAIKEEDKDAEPREESGNCNNNAANIIR